VHADSLGGPPVPGAEITILGLDQTQRTSPAGEYRLAAVPSGSHIITVRAIGFALLTDTATITPAAILVRDFVIRSRPVMLDSVVTRAPHYIAPRLRAFEARRAEGIGRFISEDQLRKNDSRPLKEILRSLVPGLLIRRPFQGTGSYLASNRNAGKGC
jgi:hypothetical protein